MVGIPCRHACLVITYRQQKPEDFIDECYSRKICAICYSFVISPINEKDTWPEVDADELHLPVYKKGPRRPK